MNKTFFTLLAIIFVFSANTNAFAQSNSRSDYGTPTTHNLNGFQAEHGLTINLVTRRHGGHQHYNKGHRRGYGNQRQGRHYRSHRFGRGGFRFNYNRPFYNSYRNYSQRSYRGYNNHSSHGYSKHNNHRNHYNGHNNHRNHYRGQHNGHKNGHGHGGHSSHNNHY